LMMSWQNICAPCILKADHWGSLDVNLSDCTGEQMGPTFEGQVTRKRSRVFLVGITIIIGAGLYLVHRE
jgi:hypothetical protein